MASVLEGLRECWPVVGYRVLDSQYFGVAQRRRRLFFVCGPTEAGVEQVLFESEGGSGDFAAGAEAGKDVAASLGSRAARPGGSAVAATLDQRGRGTSDGVMQNLQVCQALTNLGSGGPDDNEAQAGHLVTHGIGVRRLTPTECERLQGFPDGWTCLCQPLDNYDSNQCTCPDTPRYRTLGNAVTVSVAEWLGRRIARSA
jgi:DNA (cytosine-5)-methyltransferase 1